jgi:hypothetical protein
MGKETGKEVREPFKMLLMPEYVVPFVSSFPQGNAFGERGNHRLTAWN